MTHGSLFDGAGGMRIGFEQIGIKTLWTIDILNGQDIHDYGKENLQRPDIISGGPPCQKTSKLAFLRRSETQESLWPSMLRIVKEICPQWIVVEQPVVDKKIILAWIEDLHRSGYGCSARIISGGHWVPQPRPRWFIIGRMGIEGMALRDLLYPLRERIQTPQRYSDSFLFHGSCPDCLRGGIFDGLSKRSLALMGAGNGVAVPVAQWIAENIIRAEKIIDENQYP